MLLSSLIRASMLASVTLLLAVAPARAVWQDVPASLQLEPVGDSLRLNGTPMQIRAFRSDAPMEKLLRDVQDSWQRSNRGSVTRTEMSTWTVLNQTVGDEHRSFQARPSGPGHTEGFVALTSPRQAREPKPAVRLPSDMTPVSIVDSVDAGRSTQQLIAVSPRSVDASASALEAQLKAAGWERHVLKRNGSSVVFAANKGARQFDATLNAKKAGSLILINVSNN